MKPLIMDLDMGIDDALAIVLALRSPELDLMGLSVVGGAAPVEVGVRRALRVLELMGRSDLPVYLGAEGPRAVDSQMASGPQRFGATRLPESELLPAGGASDFFIESIRARPGEVMLLAAGPLTSLALAEAQCPGLLKQARRLFIVGGRLAVQENAPAASEDTFFADPDAARQVLRSDANITLVPVDVTRQLGVEVVASGQTTCRSNDPVARFVGEACSKILTWEEKHPGYSGLSLHAPLGVAMALEAEVCEVEPHWLEVEPSTSTTPGRLLVDRGQGRQVECVMGGDFERFRELFLRRTLGVD
jgi:purine nucleosidase